MTLDYVLERIDQSTNPAQRKAEFEKGCMFDFWKCDGVVDCEDESDEPKSCKDDTNASYKFQQSSRLKLRARGTKGDVQNI